jgi:hypothetical protein
MHSVLNCHNVEKHTDIYLGYLWFKDLHTKKNPGV